MGNYISIHLDCSSENSPASILAPLFSESLFQPVSIAALCGWDYFLTGYTFESFLEVFKRSDTHQPNSITIASKSQLSAAYLETISQRLEMTPPPLDEISPFETRYDEIDFSFLETPRLEADVLQNLASWLDRFAASHEIHCYGTLNLAVKKPEASIWRHTFGVLDSYSPYKKLCTPLLVISLFVDKSLSYHINLFARSPVWAKGEHWLSRYIGAEEADQNLSTLVSIAQAIIGQQGIEDITISLSGSLFWQDAERYKQVFSKLGSITVQTA